MTKLRWKYSTTPAFMTQQHMKYQMWLRPAKVTEPCKLHFEKKTNNIWFYWIFDLLGECMSSIRMANQHGFRMHLFISCQPSSATFCKINRIFQYASIDICMDCAQQWNNHCKCDQRSFRFNYIIINIFTRFRFINLLMRAPNNRIHIIASHLLRILLSSVSSV